MVKRIVVRVTWRHLVSLKRKPIIFLSRVNDIGRLTEMRDVYGKHIQEATWIHVCPCNCGRPLFVADRSLIYPFLLDLNSIAIMVKRTTEVTWSWITASQPPLTTVLAISIRYLYNSRTREQGCFRNVNKGTYTDDGPKAGRARECTELR